MLLWEYREIQEISGGNEEVEMAIPGAKLIAENAYRKSQEYLRGLDDKRKGLLDYDFNNLSTMRTDLGEALGPVPAYPKLPSYEPPTYDRQRVRQLTQTESAPQVSALRSGLLQALSGARIAENPNVGGLLANMALSGYGSGLADIMAGASRSARGQYEMERAPDIWGAQAEYEGLLKKAQAEYLSEMQNRQLLAQTLLDKFAADASMQRAEAYAPRGGGSYRNVTGNALQWASRPSIGMMTPITTTGSYTPRPYSIDLLGNYDLSKGGLWEQYGTTGKGAGKQNVGTKVFGT